MTSLMTGSFERIEVITRVARRRRWSVEEKRRIVAASLTPDLSVSLVAASQELQPNQLFRWWKLCDRQQSRRERAPRCRPRPQELALRRLRQYGGEGAALIYTLIEPASPMVSTRSPTSATSSPKSPTILSTASTNSRPGPGPPQTTAPLLPDPVTTRRNPPGPSADA